MPRNSEVVNRAFAELENAVVFEKKQQPPAMEEISASRIQLDHQPVEIIDEPKDLDGPQQVDMQQQIRDRAYSLYIQRGHVDGHATDDWLTAEAELLANR